MPLQLRPTETFVITAQIPDPNDSNTYYIRAYVRNAKTDELLTTVNLTDQGEQRFRGTWEVPADPSGEGFYVTITKKVFTDAPYITESPRYGRDEQLYLIQERYNPFLAGGGGGSDINYKTIRKIIKEEIENKIPKIDLDPIIKAIQETQKRIETIEFPVIDLSPLIELTKLNSKEIINKIGAIRIPENDLTPLIRTLDKSLEELNSFKESSDKKTRGAISDIKIALEKAITDIQKRVEENIKSIDTKIENAPTITLLERKQETIKRKRKFII